MMHNSVTFMFKLLFEMVFMASSHYNRFIQQSAICVCICVIGNLSYKEINPHDTSNTPQHLSKPTELRSIKGLKKPFPTQAANIHSTKLGSRSYQRTCLWVRGLTDKSTA